MYSDAALAYSIAGLVGRWRRRVPKCFEISGKFMLLSEFYLKKPPPSKAKIIDNPLNGNLPFAPINS